MTESVALADSSSNRLNICLEPWGRGVDSNEYAEENTSNDLDDIRARPLALVYTRLLKPGDHLCDICRQLGLNVESFAVTTENDEADKGHIFIWFIEDLKKRADCPLYHLILGCIISVLYCTEDEYRRRCAP